MQWNQSASRAVEVKVAVGHQKASAVSHYVRTSFHFERGWRYEMRLPSNQLFNALLRLTMTMYKTDFVRLFHRYIKTHWVF